MAEPEDHLYGLPLEEFTPARDAAARELRRGGDRETAARVAKLPKPSPAAWAANQVAREQPDLIDALLEAGAALREAQEAAVAGHGARGLRDATLAERGAVEAVMAAATALRPGGKPLSTAMADRLRTTLHAAAGNEAVREALAHGRLVSEAQAGGAWPFALEPGEPAAPAPKPRAKKPAAGGKAATAGDGAATGGKAATAGERAVTGDKAATAGERATTGDKATTAGGAATSGKPATAGEPAATGGKARGRGEADAAEAAEAAAREQAEREAREAAEREAAEQRKRLEAELRDARGALRVRERVAKGAQEDAEDAARALEAARETLEEAQRAVEDARDEAESAQRVAAEARDALEHARDNVARLEELLD